MIPAAVGFQCPECVAIGQAEVRSPVTPMGGSVIRRAYVTQTLIGINVGVFVVALIAGLNEVNQQYGMFPPAISVGGEWWRLLTAAFLHGGLLHVGFNMYVLFLIGPQLEALFGHVRYLVVYVLAALGGSIASYAFSPLNTLSVGASGAVFGLMAALIVAGHSLRHDVTQVVYLLAINIVIGFLVPMIDWRAHLGGAVVGAAAAAVMAYAPKQSRRLWQTLGTLAICAVLVMTLTVRTAQINSELVHSSSPVGDNYSDVITGL